MFCPKLNCGLNTVNNVNLNLTVGIKIFLDNSELSSIFHLTFT